MKKTQFINEIRIDNDLFKDKDLLKILKEEFENECRDKCDKLGMKDYSIEILIFDTRSMDALDIDIAMTNNRLYSNLSQLKNNGESLIHCYAHGMADSLQCVECSHIFKIEGANPSCVRKSMCLQCLQKHYN